LLSFFSSLPPLRSVFCPVYEEEAAEDPRRDPGKMQEMLQVVMLAL